MYLKKVVFLSVISLFSNNFSFAQLDGLIYNPYDLWIVDADTVLVNDIADKQNTLKLFDLKDEELIASVRSGRGPGEVSSIAYKRSTLYSNGDIFIWDSGRKRMTRYTSELEYKTDVRGGKFLGSIFQAALINDSTLLTVGVGEGFFKVWRIKNNRVTEKSLLWSISEGEYEELSPLINFTLLQTLFFDNFNGILYISFEFSSMVIGIEETGIVFINQEPDNIPLPPPDEESERSGRYSLPVMGKHPEGARDVSAGGDFVYVLLNGEKISRMQQWRYLVNFEALIEKVYHAERLLKYDRFTGEFIGEINLPIPARQAKVQGDTVYLLNTLGDEPIIRKYKLDEL